MKKLISILLAAGFIVYFCALNTNQAPAAQSKGKTAAENYKEHCLKCHGEQGKGDGPATKTIKGMKMADWTDKTAMAKFTDDDLFKTTSQGSAALGKSKLMPAYKEKLKENELRDLIAHVRSMAKE